MSSTRPTRRCFRASASQTFRKVWAHFLEKRIPRFTGRRARSASHALGRGLFLGTVSHRNNRSLFARTHTYLETRRETTPFLHASRTPPTHTFSGYGATPIVRQRKTVSKPGNNETFFDFGRHAPEGRLLRQGRAAAKCWLARNLPEDGVGQGQPRLLNSTGGKKHCQDRP